MCVCVCNRTDWKWSVSWEVTGRSGSVITAVCVCAHVNRAYGLPLDAAPADRMDCHWVSCCSSTLWITRYNNWHKVSHQTLNCSVSPSITGKKRQPVFFFLFNACLLLLGHFLPPFKFWFFCCTLRSQIQKGFILLFIHVPLIDYFHCSKAAAL